MESNTCLRCGSPYEPNQTVCFTCGAPIGETRSSTQPVPAVKIPRPATEPAPELERSASVPVHAAVPSVPATPGAAPPRGRRRWLVVALAVVLVLAVAGGLAYAVRVLTAGPPVARQSLYQDPQHRFRLQRPTLWLVTPLPDGVSLTDTDGASTVRVTVDLPPTPGETARAAADALAAQLGLSAAPPEQIAGQSWEQRSGQVTGTDGAVREEIVLVTLHGGQLYTIQLSSPVASYEGTNNLVFEPLLASFAFA
jgi:hypothetical protein